MYKKNTIEKSIKNIINRINESEIKPKAVYGFGSFFRSGNKIGDIDLVIDYGEEIRLIYLIYCEFHHRNDFTTLIYNYENQLGKEHNNIIFDKNIRSDENNERLNHIKLLLSNFSSFFVEYNIKEIGLIGILQILKDMDKDDDCYDEIKPIIKEAIVEIETQHRSKYLNFFQFMSWSEFHKASLMFPPLNLTMIFKKLYSKGLKGISINDLVDKKIERVLLWSKDFSDFDTNMKKFDTNKLQFVKNSFDKLKSDVVGFTDLDAFTPYYPVDDPLTIERVSRFKQLESEYQTIHYKINDDYETISALTNTLREKMKAINSDITYKRKARDLKEQQDLITQRKEEYLKSIM